MVALGGASKVRSYVRQSTSRRISATRPDRPATASTVDHRHGLSLRLVAPSLIPRRAGEGVKTNRRDAIGLAKLLRAGELTPVWVPDKGHEAMRDLVRARAAAVETQRVHRQQVSAFMLKHGRIFPRKTAWGARHLRWLQEQHFDHPAHQIAPQELVDAVHTSRERIVRIEAAIKEYLPTPGRWHPWSAPFRPCVASSSLSP